MFAGLIQNLGQIKAIEKRGTAARLFIRFKKKEKTLRCGESIAVNGVCLTAAAASAGGFTADLLPETLADTNLGRLKSGSWVNLERSLKSGDAIGGHFVTGHVDAVGKLAGITRRKGNWSLLVYAPKTIISQLAVKGSVACDGVSLTVQDKMSGRFSVAVIPHTLSATTLGRKKTGDTINLEIDILMRYLNCFTSNRRRRSAGRIHLRHLRSQGF